MKSGLITALFVSLACFGIWFQQSYMEVYSQEFELELKSDRSSAELLHVKNIDVQEFRRGVRANSFHGRELRIQNNGSIHAGGNLRYLLYDATGGTVTSEFTTPRMTGEMKRNEKGRTFFDSANRVEHLLFPGEVVALAGKDRIVGSQVRYEPDAELFTSPEPVKWTGPGRTFAGRGFRYTMGKDDLSIGGPLKGNFLPGKEDFKSFKAAR